MTFEIRFLRYRDGLFGQTWLQLCDVWSRSIPSQNLVFEHDAPLSIRVDLLKLFFQSGRGLAEVGDFRRCANARQLMAYLGLVPSEHSSDTSIRCGGITKAGNALARRVLIEGAWTLIDTCRPRGI